MYENMNWVYKVKDKWDAKKIEKLKKEVIRLREGISKSLDQEENLKTAEAIPIPANLKRHSVMKKSEKHVNNKTGHDREEKFVNTVRPDRLGQEGIKPSITMRKDKAKPTKHETPTNGEPCLEEIPTTTAMANVNNEDTSVATIRKNIKIKVCYKCGLRGHIAHNCKTENMNPRQGNKITKRCHFCRKRGHLQKDCLSKHMLRKWLRDEASEMYQNTLQQCKAWRRITNCPLHTRLLNIIISWKDVDVNHLRELLCEAW